MIFRARINELISILEKKSIKFETLNALEMFAGNGSMHTTAYANKVKSLEVWEIDSKWKNELTKNLPLAKIKIIDSVQTINQNGNLPKFDLIVIDNPIPLFGSEEEPDKYCEHFDFIKKIGNLIDDNVIIIFIINKRPFNYDKLPLWKKRRNEFYGAVDTSNMSLEFLLSFYKELFRNVGFETIFHVSVARHTPHLDYFAYNLKRIRKNSNQLNFKNVDWISLYHLFPK